MSGCHLGPLGGTRMKRFGIIGCHLGPFGWPSRVQMQDSGNIRTDGTAEKSHEGQGGLRNFSAEPQKPPLRFQRDPKGQSWHPNGTKLSF
jgi:hypothetical protein